MNIVCLLLWQASSAFAASSASFMPHYCDEALAKRSGAELRAIYLSDQGDRDGLESRAPLKGDPTEIWRKVDQDDFDHRERVAEIFAEGCLTTADDYFEAAMVYQHGHVPDHYLQAHIWAARAVQMGFSTAAFNANLPADAQVEAGGARWLAAASLDRYLMNMGYKQLYATQAKTESNDPQSCWCLWPVDGSVTDAERVARGAHSLAHQLAWIADANKTHPYPCGPAKMCPAPAKAVTKTSLPGISW